MRGGHYAAPHNLAHSIWWLAGPCRWTRGATRSSGTIPCWFERLWRATYAEREGTCNVDRACSKCTQVERDVHRLQTIVMHIRSRKFGTEWQPMIEETCEELGTNFVWADRHRKVAAKVMANMPKTAELKGLTLLAENQKALLREIGALKKESPVRMYRCHPKTSHNSPLVDMGLVTYQQLSTHEVSFSQCVQWKYCSLGRKLREMNQNGCYIQPLFIQELMRRVSRVSARASPRTGVRRPPERRLSPYLWCLCRPVPPPPSPSLSLARRRRPSKRHLKD